MGGKTTFRIGRNFPNLIKDIHKKHTANITLSSDVSPPKSGTYNNIDVHC